MREAETAPVDTGDSVAADSEGFDTVAEDSGDSDDSDDSDDSAPCPAAMVLVDGAFCVDAYEATLEERVDGAWVAASPFETVGAREVRASVGPGRTPQGYLSGDQAEIACQNAGKRLCTSDEWLSACRGPANLTWPYGDAHQSGACNDAYSGHPVVNFFGTSVGVWTSAHMNNPGINQQPGTVSRGGAFVGCVSHWGAFDLHGNLHEWVADAGGTFRGGFYADAAINGAGCTYKTTAHNRAYHDYSTGFRCCVGAASP